MSVMLWDEVFRLVEESADLVRRSRSKDRVRVTAEVFTPTELVIRLLQNLPIETFGPGKKVLDPACGDGQFLIAAKFAKVIFWRMSEAEALADIFGVDILRENVELARLRLGGGTLIVGNPLNPETRLAEQTDDDHSLMKQLFGSASQTLW